MRPDFPPQSNWRSGTESRRHGAELSRRAEERLKESPYQQLHQVRCDFWEGVLTLRGRLTSFFLKQMAQTVVSQLDGVQECDNRIEVRAMRQGFSD